MAVELRRFMLSYLCCLLAFCCDLCFSSSHDPGTRQTQYRVSNIQHLAHRSLVHQSVRALNKHKVVAVELIHDPVNAQPSVNKDKGKAVETDTVDRAYFASLYGSLDFWRRSRRQSGSKLPVHSEYRHPCVKAPVAHLLRPRLQESKVGMKGWWPSELVPLTDDLLPLLSKRPQLKVFHIRARVDNATPKDLIPTPEGCKQLSTLGLAALTDSLVDEATLGVMARHQSIETLHIIKLIDASLASSVVGIARPFGHLVSLIIKATLEAAGVILLRLERLEFLCLSVSGTGSVFPAIGKIKTLQAFSFESASFSMARVCYLASWLLLLSLTTSSCGPVFVKRHSFLPSVSKT